MWRNNRPKIEKLRETENFRDMKLQILYYVPQYCQGNKAEMGLVYSTQGKYENCIQNCCQKPEVNQIGVQRRCQLIDFINQTQYIDFLIVCINR